MRPRPPILVRQLTDAEVPAVAEIHALSFARQSLSQEWIECSHRAFPRMQFFVAAQERRVGGYVLWTQKSGFREEAVVELEQIAVHPDMRGTGIGEALVRESLPQAAAQLAERGARLKKRSGHHAARQCRAAALYARMLGARAETVITGLYSADEVIMVTRDMDAWLDSHGGETPTQADERACKAEKGPLDVRLPLRC